MSDVVIAGRGHCCDPFAVLKQEIDMAITIAMNARNIAEEALASTGAGASDNNPLPLDDTASPGSAMEWSRSDHVHPNTGLLEPDDVIAGDNIEVTDNGDGTVTIALKADQVRVGNTVLTGNVTITGNITQNGASYETHAEKIYTTKDYVIMRDGATGALGSGDYSGFQVKLYDGVNDGRLVIDNTGTARVGDVGDEQPLLTREESADLSNGDIFTWDSVNSKAVGISNNFTQGTGNIGSDTKPVKIVSGVSTPVSKDLIQDDFHSQSYTVLGCTIWIWWNSKVAIISMRDQSISTTGSETINLPFTIRTNIIASIVSGSNYYGYVYSLDGTRLQVNFKSTGLYAHFTVPTLIY